MKKQTKLDLLERLSKAKPQRLEQRKQFKGANRPTCRAYLQACGVVDAPF